MSSAQNSSRPIFFEFRDAVPPHNEQMTMNTELGAILLVDDPDEDQKHQDEFLGSLRVIPFHSANTSARHKMLLGIESIERLASHNLHAGAATTVR